MSIHEFLGGESSASWADEVADLPSTAPSPLTGGAGVSSATSTAKLRSMLPTHSESRNIPTEPPFSAYVGNLPFELNENIISNFFSPLEASTLCNFFLEHYMVFFFSLFLVDITTAHPNIWTNGALIVDIRLIRDRVTNTPKGFCIVEFATANDLAEAIRLSGRVSNCLSPYCGYTDVFCKIALH
ncbi:Eukaryotic translation initiation factor 4B [Dimargaris verticillata]|uniref:Eukaryotic translation initiation factor 4B n=1 Tax=Dimargaris verticillata TaxID=2761393 RepID=A0A9W8EAM0_9FUNG|nr:Eukaryotic translation initiation factor 4B [Dimargaris verticillata]